MSDFLSQSLTIPAGDTRVLQGGGYFRLHESSGPLLITFKGDTGANLARGIFEEGEWARFPFGQVEVKNETALSVTCKVRVSRLDSGSDQMAGSLTVSGDVLAPVPVYDGISLGAIAGLDQWRTIDPGNLSAVFFDPMVTSEYALQKINFVCDAPMAVGLFVATKGAVTAETGKWTNGMAMRAAPLDTPFSTLRVIENESAVTHSVLATTAAGLKSFGVYQPGSHCIELPAAYYMPASVSASSKGIGVVFVQQGALPCGYAKWFSGQRVIV